MSERQATSDPTRSAATGLGVAARALAIVCAALLPPSGDSLAQQPGPAPEVVVHASELPESALSEFDFWNDAASPGGRLVGTPNHGGDLDPPPENDPHVTFKVRVQRGVPYRCWIRMKVGQPKGQSQANLFYVQFTGAVDQAGQEILKPRSPSYLSVRGPAREGWAWTGHGQADPPRVYFAATGEVTVRMQAGMEGVGFDQFVLSPARFLEKPPTEAVVAKPK